MENLFSDPVFKKYYLQEDCNVNSGGCGIYALAVARYLMKHYDYSLSLMACCQFQFQRKEITDNNNIIGNVPSHVVIVVNDEICIDAIHGMVPINVFTNEMENMGRDPVIIDFIESDLIDAINDTFSWNFQFDRSTYVPEFIELFNVDLSDVVI